MEQAHKGKEIWADVVQAAASSVAIQQAKAKVVASDNAMAAKAVSAAFNLLAPIRIATLWVPALNVCNGRSKHYKSASLS